MATAVPRERSLRELTAGINRAIAGYQAAAQVYDGCPTDATWQGLLEAGDALRFMLAHERALGQSLHEYHTVRGAHRERVASLLAPPQHWRAVK